MTHEKITHVSNNNFTMTLFHHVTMSLYQYETIHHVTMTPCHYVIMTLHNYDTVSLCHRVSNFTKKSEKKSLKLFPTQVVFQKKS